jgi:DNA-directed RNA polymerase subunit beta'
MASITNKQQSRSKDQSANDFEEISLKVASPERILAWSYGEVTKPETMNYRTQRSEKNGLFDEKIFGPDKDFECYCGKYRGVRFKGIICEKCGVEITRSIVRRERMGHIELSTPVSHIWFLRTLPSRISLVLGMSSGELEKVIYFAGYLVTSVNEEEKKKLLHDLDQEYKTKVKSLNDEKTKTAVTELLMTTKRDIESIAIGRVLDEIEYHRFALKYGTTFEAEIGAEAVYKLFKNIDLDKLHQNLLIELEKAGSTEREKLNRRISLIRGMINAKIRPEWMFLTRIPVIPAALRPMVALEGGRHATSDINDLYRRVINRNNRLRKLKEINAPEVILRNEKRILQEAVDALIDNSIRHGNALFAGVNQAQRRPLKSLSDNIRGKRGLFRQNLLGKRVDYSGRSVIVVGPELRLNQCGLPKHMALELFRPFVISKLLEKELAFNIRGASRLIDDGIAEVWAILEEVIKDKYVLLNRAPTLHRLGIQAFQPVLIEGNAIQVHPMVCSAFNADFDGDTMAVHLPLGEEAQIEAREIMASDKNILKPGSGDPTITAKLLDVVLGAFWMTKLVDGDKGEGKVFESPEMAVLAQNYGHLSMRAKIKVLAPDTAKYKQLHAENNGLFETSVGRILFNDVLPAENVFINKEVNKSVMAGIVDDLIANFGIDSVPIYLDKVKNFGFKYVTTSGITWGIDDVSVPEGKAAIIERAKKSSDEIISQFEEGLLSEEERIRKNLELWYGIKDDIEKLIPATLDKNGSVFDMVQSGARGSIGNITQMAGMKGLIVNSRGETIEVPVISSTKEGLTPIEYFITTHGARKGLTDTALNTANAGYLTRKLFVVAQDIMINEEDCGTKDGILISKETASGIETAFAKTLNGRVLSEDLKSKDGSVAFERNHMISKNDAKKIEAAGVSEVKVRSPLTCRSEGGICQNCYGLDLGKNKLIDLGEAVGTVAAQAIGEPGTQLTMRTFHAGGTASVGGDITQGLPRVTEIFEKRKPKNPILIADTDGMVTEIRSDGREKTIVITPDIAEKGKSKTKGAHEFVVHYMRTPMIKVGSQVKKGDFLTDGSADIEEVFKLAGKEKAQEYVIAEVKKLYELQGEAVSRKHIEVIVRQMFNKTRVKDGGDTAFSAGDIVEHAELAQENKRVKKEGGIEAKGDLIVMGITESSLTRRNFLSAASFQNTSKVLINTAVRGGTDTLTGLMENVLIGRLIPAGSGFKGSKKADMIENELKLMHTRAPKEE